MSDVFIVYPALLTIVQAGTIFVDPNFVVLLSAWRAANLSEVVLHIRKMEEFQKSKSRKM